MFLYLSFKINNDSILPYKLIKGFKMISKNDVKYIANLSRIHLEDDEILTLKTDLENILEYVKKLEKLNTDNVKPTSHVLELKNVYREDYVKESLSQENALKFAVEKFKGSFKVPKVIE